MSLLNEEATKIEHIDFVWCYPSWVNDGIDSMTNIGIEMLMLYPNIYSCESIYLFKENSTIWFYYQNDYLENLKG